MPLVGNNNTTDVASEQLQVHSFAENDAKRNADTFFIEAKKMFEKHFDCWQHLKLLLYAIAGIPLFFHILAM